MRNLKKILALVLALVMSLSLMATASAASFPDVADDNAYKTAIDVLNGVKVFQGYNDGAEFRPTGEITRAEVAAIIYRISTGDVTDSQKDIYTAWNGAGKLSDVTTGWYAGYVNFCSNAGYIKGYPDGTFKAGNKVTGYEVLAMILRAVGYGRNGEFSGSRWAITVGSLAETLGITKNVVEPLGSPATREMVAEILFRAIFTETQKYNALYMYEGTGTNLAANLGLEKVSGVVTANKWANLYGTVPLAEGKSRLALDDGSVYTVNADSTGEQVGLRINAYVQNKTDVIGGLETSDVNVVKSNAGAEISVKKLRDELKVDETTEYFVNYSDAVEIGKSDWRIEYYIGLEGGAAAWTNLVSSNGGEWGYTIAGTKDNEIYNKVIKVGDTITAQDMEFMQEIFYGSDNKNEASQTGTYYGEVFVATRTGSDGNGNSYDVSDDLSWRQFIDKYIDSTLEKFDGCDNGESLRVIDHDGDGVAEYVLRVDFVMTTIVDYNKKLDRWTVEYEADENPERFTDIKNSDIVADSELTVGDVVLYALVDGVYYTEHPQTFTASIDKKGIDAKAGTIVCEGETYTWSGIEKEAKQFFTEILDADVGTNYVFYKDHFGYIRMFTTPNGDLVLVTDGFFASDKRTDEVKASIYNDAEGAVKDYTLANNDDGFVFEGEGTEDWGNRGTWGRLHTFGSYYYESGSTYEHYVQYPFETNNKKDNRLDPFTTNIALGAAEDGTTLQDVRSLDHRLFNYNAYEVADTLNGASASVNGRPNPTAMSQATTLWGIEWLNDDVRADATGLDTAALETPVEIRTTDMTRYYLVNSEGEIETWIGRKGGERGNFEIKKAYVVTSEASTAEVDYKIAEVVVIEGLKKESTANPIMPIRVMGSKNHTQESLTRSGKDTTSLILSLSSARELDAPAVELDLMLRFYDGNLNKKGINAEITADYASYGIYAGKMSSHSHTGWRVDDTIYRAEIENEIDSFAPYGEVEFYQLVVKTGETSAVYAYDVEEVDNMTKLSGNRVIYLTNTDGEVNVILNIDQTVNTKGDKIAAPDQLVDLYNEIVYDYLQYSTVRVQLDKENTPLSEYITSIVAPGATSKVLEYAPGNPVVIPLSDIAVSTAKGVDAAKFSLNKSSVTDVDKAGIHIIVGESSDDTRGESIHASTSKGDGKNPWWHIKGDNLYIENVNFAKGGWAEVWVTFETSYTDDEIKGLRVKTPEAQKDDRNQTVAEIASVSDTKEVYSNQATLAASFAANDEPQWMPGHIIEVTLHVRGDYKPNEPVVTDAEGESVIFVAPYKGATSALKYVGTVDNEVTPAAEGEEEVDPAGTTYEWTYKFIMPQTKITIGGDLAEKGEPDTTPAPVIPAEPGVSVAPELEDKVTIEETNMEDEETNVDISTGYELDNVATSLGAEDAEGLEAKAQYTINADADAFVDGQLQFGLKTAEGEIPVVPSQLPEGVEKIEISPAPATMQKKASTVTDWLVVVFLKADSKVESVGVEVVVVGLKAEEEPPVDEENPPVEGEDDETPVASVKISRALLYDQSEGDKVENKVLNPEGYTAAADQDGNVKVTHPSITSHQNDNGSDSKKDTWVGFQVALDNDENGWTHVTFKWKNKAEQTIALENLPENAKGIAFYYGAEERTENGDTVEVTFVKKSGDTVELSSTKVTYKVTFQVTVTTQGNSEAGKTEQ